MKSPYCLLLIFIILSLCACEEEMMEDAPFCLSAIGPGVFFLTDESKDKFPYQEVTSADSLTFIDSNGDEYKAYFSELPEFSIFNVFPNNAPCLNDTTQTVRILGEYERLSTELNIRELDLRFRIQYSVNHNNRRYTERIWREFGNILVSSIDRNNNAYFELPIPQIVLTVNENNWPVNSQIVNFVHHDQLELNNTTFDDVYSNVIGVDKFEIYFNYELGVIGFKDFRDNVLYSLQMD